MVTTTVSLSNILTEGKEKAKANEVLAEIVMNSTASVINTSNEREAFTAAKEHLVNMIRDYSGDCTMLELLEAGETFYQAYLMALNSHKQ